SSSQISFHTPYSTVRSDYADQKSSLIPVRVQITFYIASLPAASLLPFARGKSYQQNNLLIFRPARPPHFSASVMHTIVAKNPGRNSRYSCHPGKRVCITRRFVIAHNPDAGC